MANYLFETMTDAQALSYDPSTDSLFFLTGGAGDISVTYNPAGGISAASITLSNGTVSHTFGADALSGEDLTFFGSSSDDTLGFGGDSTADHGVVNGVEGAGARYYGLGGADSIDASVANDTLFGGDGADTIHGASNSTENGGDVNEADYYNGGAGADSILGGDGNDHIWGNEYTTTAGTTDGADTISAGLGNDYVNGNAGNDLIHGDDGNDRLYGGANNDTITGDDGNDYLQGNKGADSLDGGIGADTIHGGADNDVLLGGAGNDQLFGDVGNDTVTGGAGYDWLSGGTGNDTFTFDAGDASNANVATAATAANHGLTDVIADFTDGADHIALGFAVSAVLHTAAGVTFSDAAAAQTYAQGLLSASTGTHGTEVAAITVGSDTYLFYDDTHASATINAAIKVTGVADTVFNVGTNSDFA
jgi:Ca2+-binding RTX toxin-like protein